MSIAVLGAPHAVAQADPDRKQDLADRLSVRAPPVGQASLLPGSAGAYASARRALARGRPGAALDALMPRHGDLLADREALLRGDALLALGEPGAAQAAYELALGAARVTSVARAAIRGLVEVHTQLGHLSEAQAHLDALLSTSKHWAERPRLQLAQAQLKADSGDSEEALKLADRITQAYPGSREAPAAAALVAQMRRRGVPMPGRTDRDRRRHLKALIDARMLEEADSVYETLDPKDPRVRLLGARIAERRGHIPLAEAMLLELTNAGVPDSVAAQALDRLARRRLRSDDNEAALRFFDQLVARSPRNRRARSAEYLAGWIPYDAGRYREAHTRMLRYASGHPSARDRDEALWYAGWSSYLGADLENAEAAFRRILDEHEDSTLVAHVYYWLGRIAQRRKQPEKAKQAFREVLERAPLGYYGLWASHRLEALKVRVALPKPTQAPKGTTSVEAILQALGPERPVTVDRAVHLHRAELDDLALEELQSASRDLRKTSVSPELKTRVAELLQALGAHHLAFQAVSGMAEPGAKLPPDDPLLWTAWRYAYPQAFEDAVRRARLAHEVQSEMVWAVMRTESLYQPKIQSRVGARGLMQLMPATARQIGRTAEGGKSHAVRYREPESNIWLGAWYLKRLIERYGGQFVAAAGAYNGGPTAMDRWLNAFDGMALDEFVERIPYRETRRYVRRVVETWAIYQHLYTGTRPSLPATIRKVVEPTSKASF